mgnify:FL=1|jgi:hypothetical protein|tara:strand:- start:121 stop:603 length:483 start_codon:yes stop_codon:yes gene_type:complete
MNKVYACIGIFLSLAASRFIPHPPNFTSLLALSFYVPVLFGLRYIPVLLLSFVITDLVVGYHTGTHWTWGSVLIIGLMSQYFSKNINLRLAGSLFGAFIFFLITNFGVWISGMYSLTINGLIECYTLAIPFFTYSIISTALFSLFIETGYKFYKIKFFKA